MQAEKAEAQKVLEKPHEKGQGEAEEGRPRGGKPKGVDQEEVRGGPALGEEGLRRKRQAVARALADRVPFFATLNEPWCSAFLGHWTGEHAPGLRTLEAALRAAHHLLLGHGLAVEALRAAGARRVGIVLNFAPAYGEDPEAVDVADRYHNRFFLDPILGKGYPESPFRDPPPVPILSRDL